MLLDYILIDCLLEIYRYADSMDKKQVDILRKMTPAQKMRAMSSLLHTAKFLQVAGIRSRHPGISDQELHQRVRDAMLYARK